MPFKIAAFADLRILLATLGGVICLLAATGVAAQEARLKNITLSSTDDDRMVVSLRVANAFTPEMLTALREGALTEFTFRIRLHRNRNMWLDEKLIAINVVHSLAYDPVRETYRIYRSWSPDPVVESRSLTEAQSLMSQIERLPILPLASMHKGEGYELRAKAELSKVTLPFYLRYVFYFVALWDFETEWHTVFFIY